MKNSSSSTEQMDWEARPAGMLVQRREDDDHDHSGPLIKINVSHGLAQHEVHVPAQSTFGYMKNVIEEKTGLEPERQKILFRGKEKEDWEYLHDAGVKDKAKVLVLDDPVTVSKETKGSEEALNSNRKESEETLKVEMKEKEEMLKVLQAIDEIRAEVDKLAERVAALEVAVNCGTKVADDEFVISSELLMRQLLKLDVIEAQGEAKMQRKAEVCRVQNFLEILDNLKARNSKPFSNGGNALSVTTEWETFDSGVGSLSPPPPMPSSTRITQDWERFD